MNLRREPQPAEGALCRSLEVVVRVGSIYHVRRKEYNDFWTRIK
jgi:hypothetical protein